MGDVNRKVEKCNGTFEILFYPRVERDIISIVNVGGKKRNRAAPRKMKRVPQNAFDHKWPRVLSTADGESARKSNHARDVSDRTENRSRSVEYNIGLVEVIRRSRGFDEDPNLFNSASVHASPVKVAG